MITVRIQVVLVALLVLYLYIGRRERARRAEEGIPTGLAGFREDFKRRRPDRLFLLVLFVSWAFFTFYPMLYRWFSSQALDQVASQKIWIWWFGGLFATSLWFFWRRRELERLHTFQAAAAALIVVVVALLVSAYKTLPAVGNWDKPDPLAFLRIATVAFFAAYFILRRSARS